jgi:hypothetical protein
VWRRSARRLLRQGWSRPSTGAAGCRCSFFGGASVKAIQTAPLRSGRGSQPSPSGPLGVSAPLRSTEKRGAPCLNGWLWSVSRSTVDVEFDFCLSRAPLSDDHALRAGTSARMPRPPVLHPLSERQSQRRRPAGFFVLLTSSVATRPGDRSRSSDFRQSWTGRGARMDAERTAEVGRFAAGSTRVPTQPHRRGPPAGGKKVRRVLLPRACFDIRAALQIVASDDR